LFSIKIKLFLKNPIAFFFVFFHRVKGLSSVVNEYISLAVKRTATGANESEKNTRIVKQRI
jgi:hypothetical protein